MLTPMTIRSFNGTIFMHIFICATFKFVTFTHVAEGQRISDTACIFCYYPIDFCIYCLADQKKINR